MTWNRLRLSPIAAVCGVVCIIGGTFAPTVVSACEGGGEETEELLNAKATFEEKYKFPGAPPETLNWNIYNGDATEEVTLGVLTLGGTDAADYSENNGCDNAKLKPKIANKCTDVITFNKLPGTVAIVTGSGTYTNGNKVTYELKLSH
jgi:hypothetical protein